MATARVYPGDQGSGALSDLPVVHSFPAGTLPEGAPLYWRVTAENTAGDTLCTPSHFRFRVVPPGQCSADLNDDGATDVLDFAQFLTGFGMEEGATFEDGDLNGDGRVDVLDFAQYLVDFGCEE